MGRTFIAKLRSIRGLCIQCPSCEEEFPLKRAAVFGMHDAYPWAAQQIIAERVAGADYLKADLAERKKRLAEAKKRKPKQIAVGAEGSNFGQISEQVLPAFSTFPYTPNECRILLRPIDYVVFAGLSRKRSVESIKFVDVKTGRGQLSRGQRQIRECVSSGKIKHTVIEP